MEQRDRKVRLTNSFQVASCQLVYFSGHFTRSYVPCQLVHFSDHFEHSDGIFSVRHPPEGLDYRLEDRQTIAHVVQANCLAAPLSANRR